MRLEFLTVLASALLATAAHSADATADIVDREGNNLGAVRVHDTASGVALATLTLSNLPKGSMRFTCTRTATASPRLSSSAGGHIAEIANTVSWSRADLIRATCRTSRWPKMA